MILKTGRNLSLIVSNEKFNKDNFFLKWNSAIYIEKCKIESIL